MNSDILAKLLSMLGSKKVLHGDDLLERYNHIWRMDEPLLAQALVLPESTEEVSKILRLCNEQGQTVAVFGGLTNLVGSTVTKAQDIVISLERMNTIEEVDTKSRTMTVQAGVILETIQDAAQDVDLLFPLNFGAKGTARIGGIISTNAGGLRVVRYGMTRNLVLGLEVVLADGTILSSLKKIIKDNSGYDLKQLFIGAEGTLGVITKAVLKLVEAPKSRSSAFVAFNDYAKVVDFLKYMDAGLAGTLSGFELIWGNTYQAMTSPPSLANPPLPHGYKYYVLVESLGSDPTKDLQLLEDLLEKAVETDAILDACLAQTVSDLNWFWSIREDVGVVVTQVTHDQHYDISLPIPLIGSQIDEAVAKLLRIPGVEKVFPFGHVADGNIHLIVGKADLSDDLKAKINAAVYPPLQAIGGSVSAEHGIGLDKKAYLHISKSPAEMVVMRSLKRTLDPNNILNRGMIFDVEV